MPTAEKTKSPQGCNVSDLRDKQIRIALTRHLRRIDPNAAIFNELPLLRGSGRADVVTVNGAIRGYEIKSDRDSLARLHRQCGMYQQSCEYVTIVITAKHLTGIRRVVPQTWGISVAHKSTAGRILIRRIRAPRYNQPIASVLIRQLWKRESLKLLSDYGMRLDQNASIRNVWATLESLPRRVIEEGVRRALKQRRPQVAQRLVQCGG